MACVQLLCSSELSPQSLSRSQTNRLGIHLELLQRNLSGPQPLGKVVAEKNSSLDFKLLISRGREFNDLYIE